MVATGAYYWNMTSKLTIHASAWLTALAVICFTGGVSSPASAATCEVTRPLTRASIANDSLDLGASITRYSFRAGQANSSPYEARFTVSKSNLNYTTLTPTTAPYLRDRSQKSLANEVSALVHVNGDFFDFSSHMPYSAIARGGQLNYSPQGKSKVLGIRLGTASAKTGILARVTAKSGSKSFAVSGLNLPLLSGSTIVAYTSQFQSATLPRADFSMLVVSGKVKTVYASGTTVRPKSGYVFSAVGSAASSLRKLAVGSAFTYKAPTGRMPVLSRDSLVAAGVVTSSAGKALTSINAVNFWSSSYSSGAVVFDEDYDATPPRGSATVVVAANGVVTRVSTNGASVSVPVNGTVIQFYGSAASKIIGFQEGQKVTIKRSFTTTSGNSYDTVFGIGATLISKGTVVAPCTGNSDTVRPRTAVGWDDFGNVYLATTTMGRDWADGGAGGYRVGGSTVHQIADWLRDVGATNAVSLDGGGSTTMFAKLDGSYRRVDLPDGVWVRAIPVGVALISR